MAALARPRPLFPTRFYLGNRSLRCSTSCIPAVVLHPWSRVLRGTCRSIRNGRNAKERPTVLEITHKDASGPKICQQLQAPSKTPKERAAHRADRPESGDNSASIAQNVLYTTRHQFCRFCCSGAISAGHQAIRLLTTSIVLKELKTIFFTWS